MARKTVEVETIRETVNQMLASRETTNDAREGAIAVLESVLFSTGNYGGFRYLDGYEFEGRETRREYIAKFKKKVSIK